MAASVGGDGAHFTSVEIFDGDLNIGKSGAGLVHDQAGKARHRLCRGGERTQHKPEKEEQGLGQQQGGGSWEVPGGRESFPWIAEAVEEQRVAIQVVTPERSRNGS